MTATTRQPGTETLATDRTARRYEDVIDLLPSVENPTPLVRLRRAVPEDLGLYLKLEWMNPFGSIKDRAAAYLIDDLGGPEAVAGRDLVEASSGNTAIALAALSALAGAKLTVAIPDGVPEEKKLILRMLGAEVWPTPDDLCPVDNPKDGAIALARSLAASEGGERYLWPNQYENEANTQSHVETTGPEIWNQTDGEVAAFYAGFGTCGTISGIGRYLKSRNPDVRVVAVEPKPGHRLPGLKSFAEAKEPGILDRSVIDDVIVIDDAAAYETTFDLWRKEALMVGPSTGAIVAAVLQDEDRPAGPIVGVSPDAGTKYMSYFSELLGEDGTPRI